MKYTLIGDNDYSNPIETVLNNREVEDIKKLLKPTVKDTYHYSKLNNIISAVEIVTRHAEQGNEVFVQVDSDP